jgi:hypothetical protein
MPSAGLGAVPERTFCSIRRPVSRSMFCRVARLMIGSVTLKVLAHATVPVLVYG